MCLDVTEPFVGKELEVEGVRPLPGFFVGLRPEGSDVLRAAGKGEHRNGFADPHALIF